MLIGIIGLNGCGKDTAADYIALKLSCKKVSLSDIVRKEVSLHGLDSSNRDDLNLVSESLRKTQGPDYLVKRALKDFAPNDNLVLSSFRHPLEITLLKSKKGVIIRIDANQKTRYERTRLRLRDVGDSFEKFIEKENRELSNPDPEKMQIAKCLKMADFVIDNNDSRDSLFSKIDSLIKKL